jgi:hypothetical protein
LKQKKQKFKPMEMLFGRTGHYPAKALLLDSISHRLTANFYAQSCSLGSLYALLFVLRTNIFYDNDFSCQARSFGQRSAK